MFTVAYETTTTTTTTTSKLIITIIAITFCYWLWKRRDFYKFAFKFPCQWGLPLFGVLPYVRTVNNLLPYLTNTIERTKQSTFLNWIAITPLIFTIDPEVAEQILGRSEFLEKAATFYGPMKNALNGGTIALPVKQWHHNRKIIVSTLRQKQLLSFIPIFNRMSRKFLELIENKYCMNTNANGAAPELSTDLRICLLSISKETTMGYSDTTGDLDQNLSKIFHGFAYTARNVFLETLFECAKLGFLIRFNPKFLWIKRNLKNISNEILAKNAKDLIKNGEFCGNDTINNDDDQVTSNKPQIFIEQALKFYANGELEWSQITGEINALLIASFETTAITVYSVLVLLAMHPSIQQRVYEELQSYKNSENQKESLRNVEYEDVEYFKYLEMVINEAMRLFPPAPLLARQVNEETPLQVQGNRYVLPKKMQLVISVYHLHRLQSVWGPMANSFDPDNFLPEKIAKRHPYAFLPFSKGQRNCIGWKYAYISMKIMLVHILSKYHISTDFKYENIKITTSIMLEYQVEPLLIFKRRD